MNTVVDAGWRELIDGYPWFLSEEQYPITRGRGLRAFFVIDLDKGAALSAFAIETVAWVEAALEI